MAENDQNSSGENTNESQEGQGSQRSIESVTAEFSRKTAKLSEENARMSQQLEKMMAYLEQQRVSTSPTSSNQSEENLEDLAYTNPKLYAAKVAERAKKEALNAVNQTFAEQQKTNTVLTQLAAEYPELADNNSDLTRKAVEIYKSMSDSERSSPIAYKVAVRDAAADLGVLPKGKRSKSSTNEPNISSSSVANNLSSKAPTSGKISEQTLEIAALMGLDVSNKDVVKNLEKRSQRKNWGKYE